MRESERSWCPSHPGVAIPQLIADTHDDSPLTSTVSGLSGSAQSPPLSQGFAETQN